MLLHISSRPEAWGDWFRAQGVEIPECHGMYFEQFITASQAAVAGLGTALIPMFLLQGELERGELVTIFDLPYTSPFGYYLVQPRGRRDYGPAAAFRSWLLEEVKKKER
jgi:LysR family glycine cleavage system transcriptional activator